MSEFINADCLEAMKGYEDNHFDLAIVDPPYGIGKFWGGGDLSAQPKILALRKRQNQDWNNQKPPPEYFQELKRVSKNQIIWGWNYYTDILGSTNALIYWYKRIGTHTYSDGELAYSSFKHQVLTFDYALAKDNRNKVHPCQKPTALYRWLLHRFANPGDLILDTHVGSASSLIACEDMGFEYVGYELDKDYYLAALKRLNNHKAQLKIF